MFSAPCFETVHIADGMSVDDLFSAMRPGRFHWSEGEIMSIPYQACLFDANYNDVAFETNRWHHEI